MKQDILLPTRISCFGVFSSSYSRKPHFPPVPSTYPTVSIFWAKLYTTVLRPCCFCFCFLFCLLQFHEEMLERCSPASDTLISLLLFVIAPMRFSMHGLDLICVYLACLELFSSNWPSPQKRQQLVKKELGKLKVRIHSSLQPVNFLLTFLPSTGVYPQGPPLTPIQLW